MEFIRIYFHITFGIPIINVYYFLNKSLISYQNKSKNYPNNYLFLLSHLPWPIKF